MRKITSAHARPARTISRQTVRSFSAALIVSAALTGSAMAAGSYGDPIITGKEPVSVEIEKAVNAILAPLDTAAKPIDAAIRPVTGSAGFAGQHDTDVLQIKDRTTPGTTTTGVTTDLTANPGATTDPAAPRTH